MDTNTTNRKAVEDLAVGDHVSDTQGVHEVMHRFPFRNGDGRPAIALTLRPLGHGEPWVARHPEGHHLHLATDDEVQEFHDAARRMALSTALHQLANDIVDRELPVPRYSLNMSACLDSREQLDRWARQFGVAVTAGGTAGNIPIAAGGIVAADGPRIDVRFQAPSEPEPEPEPEACPCLDQPEPVEQPEGLDSISDQAAGMAAADEAGELPALEPADEAEQVWVFTFGSGQQFDGRYVLIYGTHDTARAEMVRVFGNRWSHQYESVKKAGVLEFDLIELPKAMWPMPGAEQEHRHVGGSAGGPGENSAECACGITYAGFDTHAEAAELIARHVAEATATPTRQAGE